MEIGTDENKRLHSENERLIELDVGIYSSDSICEETNDCYAGRSRNRAEASVFTVL